MCVFIQICPAHAQPSGCLFSAVQLLPPSFDDFFKIIRRLFRLSAAVHAFALGCRDALGLPLADVVPFGLSDIAEDLQDQIRDECPGEVLFLFPVLSSGMSKTTTSTFFSLVMICHCCRISS